MYGGMNFHDLVYHKKEGDRIEKPSVLGGRLIQYLTN